MKLNKFKSIFVIITIVALLPLSKLNGQEELVLGKCFSLLDKSYISTGQPMRVFLTGDEVAEMRTTFFRGNIYRIVACSSNEENIIFSLYDNERNLLFDSQNANSPDFWDFKINGSTECIIEARLKSNQNNSTFAMLVIGFKNDTN